MMRPTSTLQESPPLTPPSSDWPGELVMLGYQESDLVALQCWPCINQDVTVLSATDSISVAAKTLFSPLLNSVPNLHRYLRRAYLLLPVEGRFIVRLETNGQRKARLYKRLPPGLRRIRYTFDFMLHRLFPRLYPVKVLYRKAFPAHRALSKAEVLGRLYHAGFVVDETRELPASLLIVARKAVPDHIQPPHPSEGILLRMKRIGKGGLPFNVYKLRTMHPYSEYLQEYLIQTSGLESGGKFRDDFRISTLGRLLRKYWLDELPMVINLLKGDLKLVGVRPISAHYLSLYPDELRQERAKTKPGLIPPYYADLPDSFDEIVESELRYLRSWQQAPFTTDLRYLWKVIYNIFWKRARSK